jgi:hypothetical protein
MALRAFKPTLRQAVSTTPLPARWMTKRTVVFSHHGAKIEHVRTQGCAGNSHDVRVPVRHAA